MPQYPNVLGHITYFHAASVIGDVGLDAIAQTHTQAVAQAHAISTLNMVGMRAL